MAHVVTCVYCKKRFDRDKYPFIQVSKRRYAHKECSEEEDKKISQEEKDKQTLEEYIKKLLAEDYISPRVRKQIKDYRENYNYTYSGIYKALVYFYEVKKNPTEKANGGIGIVPYIYKDAFNYYYALWEAKQVNQGKVLTEYVPEEKIIKIPVPQKQIKKRRLFTFLEEEEL